MTRHEAEFTTSIPLAFSKLFKTDVDWDYETTYVRILYSQFSELHGDRPQTALGSRPIYWPRGKILGGTRSVRLFILFLRLVSSTFLVQSTASYIIAAHQKVFSHCLI